MTLSGFKLQLSSTEYMITSRIPHSVDAAAEIKKSEPIPASITVSRDAERAVLGLDENWVGVGGGRVCSALSPRCSVQFVGGQDERSLGMAISSVQG
ncbi:hypothetical protein CDAR_208581 [Caerostris darwini]|uniref:Uncharacterized protein n=1 Tax=Caerostris darwini TaxID=1538125 RepID=A0AAV4VSC6_9ARAC|nr:hypothetical protein CDAR_208581 [Caerostris darwini]